MKLRSVCFHLAMSLTTLACLCSQGQAEVIVLYQDASDLAGISQLDTDPANGVFTENITNSAIGDGDALRLADLSTGDKPEAWWDLATPISGGLRLDMSAAIANLDPANTEDINLRFGNSLDSGRPSSSARTWTTISFEQDGSLKPDGSTEADFGMGPLDMSFVINIDQANTLTYTLNGTTQVMDPSEIHTWVNGVLVEDNEALSIGGSIVQSGGIDELGFTGSSNAATGMDFSFDNMILYTGADISDPAAIPEPSSAALLLSGLFSLGLARRRKI